MTAARVIAINTRRKKAFQLLAPQYSVNPLVMPRTTPSCLSEKVEAWETGLAK